MRRVRRCLGGSLKRSDFRALASLGCMEGLDFSITPCLVRPQAGGLNNYGAGLSYRWGNRDCRFGRRTLARLPFSLGRGDRRRGCSFRRCRLLSCRVRWVVHSLLGLLSSRRSGWPGRSLFRGIRNRGSRGVFVLFLPRWGGWRCHRDLRGLCRRCRRLRRRWGENPRRQWRNRWWCRFDVAWPAGDEGDADAAFVHVAFDAAQGA